MLARMMIIFTVQTNLHFGTVVGSHRLYMAISGISIGPISTENSEGNQKGIRSDYVAFINNMLERLECGQTNQPFLVKCLIE